MADHGLSLLVHEGTETAGQHEVRAEAALREERLGVVGDEVVEVVVRGGEGLTRHLTPHTTPAQAAEPLVDFNEGRLVLSHEVKTQLARIILSSGTARATQLNNFALFSPHLETTIVIHNIINNFLSISHLRKLEEVFEIHFL